MNPSTSRRRVDGWLVLAIALVLSVLISWGTLSEAMHGDTDMLAAGAHYLVGLALSWAGVFGFASLVSAYAAGTAAAAPRPEPATPPAARRTEDPAPGQGSGDGGSGGGGAPGEGAAAGAVSPSGGE